MRLADRRNATRFEIVGELWGSVQALEPLRVCNLAPEGALVESVAPLPVGSVQPIRLMQGTRDHRPPGRGQAPLAGLSGRGRTPLQVGLEFLNVDEDAARCDWNPHGRASRERGARTRPDMENGFIERRRSPRVPIGSGAQVVRPVSMAVRLLDLSSDGVLLSCPDPVAPGAVSRVIARLGSRPLDAELDVRHVSSQWDQRARRLPGGGAVPRPRSASQAGGREPAERE